MTEALEKSVLNEVVHKRLLADISAVCVCDSPKLTDRRAMIVYPLLGPRAAIDDSEIDRSVVALAVLATCFRNDGRTTSVPVAEFFECAAAALRAEFERSGELH